MTFDAEGNAWVAEMHNANIKYIDSSLKPQGRIVVLKDTDGDGRADQSIIFADSLNDPTSVLLWKGGVIVTAAPDILYLKDTNGDGRADKREVLFSGFSTRNEDAVMNSLRFSVDNWIYVNNDGQVGEISFHRKPKAPKLAMQGYDLRFNLNHNQFQRATGPGQFGQAFDDWGIDSLRKTISIYYKSLSLQGICCGIRIYHPRRRQQ
jgi:putative membrane-bound dehydrogenase-like protein